MDLLDTDVLIDVQRGFAPALSWFATLQDLPAVPGFVAMELLQDAQSGLQVRQVLRLIAPLEVVWPSETFCHRALADFAICHRSHGLGLIDALIPACALEFSATLYTFNLRHYRAVPGLQIARPYTR